MNANAAITPDEHKAVRDASPSPQASVGQEVAEDAVERHQAGDHREAQLTTDPARRHPWIALLPRAEFRPGSLVTPRAQARGAGGGPVRHFARSEFPLSNLGARTSPVRLAGECDPLGRLAKRAAILACCALALAACFGSEGDRPSLMEGGQAGGPQPFPDNFRTDSAGPDARLAQQSRRRARRQHGRSGAAGDRRPAALCQLPALHAARDRWHVRAMRERAIVYRQRPGDRVVDRAGELCAGAVYAPFPELEKMTR